MAKILLAIRLLKDFGNMRNRDYVVELEKRDSEHDGDPSLERGTIVGKGLDTSQLAFYHSILLSMSRTIVFLHTYLLSLHSHMHALIYTHILYLTTNPLFCSALFLTLSASICLYILLQSIFSTSLFLSVYLITHSLSLSL